jgi:hypothetical protein
LKLPLPLTWRAPYLHDLGKRVSCIPARIEIVIAEPALDIRADFGPFVIEDRIPSRIAAPSLLGFGDYKTRPRIAIGYSSLHNAKRMKFVYKKVDALLS